MPESLTAEDLEFYSGHFDIMDPHESALRGEAVELLAERCPVAHSDRLGGYWIVNSYVDVLSVLENWQTFAATPEAIVVPRPSNKRAMPPLEVDPPVQREYRHMIQPYLTPRRVAEFESEARSLATTLIDSFIESGSCDLSAQFTRSFVGGMLYRCILGAEESEVEMIHGWTDAIHRAPGDPASERLQANYNEWIDSMIERRRNEPRKDDLIDGLLHGTVGGRPLANDEIAGCLEVLIGGGLGTTSDVTLSIMLRLTERPDLRDCLRGDPGLIPTAIDEFLRFDPPIAVRPRLCIRDTRVGDQSIANGERVVVFLAPANRDPVEFADANILDIDRGRNRHLSFGVGMHRCVGSNFARLNLRVGLEELITRLVDVHITPGDRVRYEARQAWGPTYLPLSFTSGSRNSAA